MFAWVEFSPSDDTSASVKTRDKLVEETTLGERVKSETSACEVSATWQWTLTALAAAVLVACGGGGSVPLAGSSSVVAESPASVVSGAIVKGPVANATVCAYELLAPGKGPQLGCTTSNSDGSYSLRLQYTGGVIVEATGGSYTDESSGLGGIALAVPLTVAGSVGAGTQQLIATPLTSLAFNKALVGGNLSAAGFELVSGEVAAAFGLPGNLQLSRTLPVVSGGTNAYGDVLIGVSKMLGNGATLAGVIANTDLGSVKSGYALAHQPVCGGGMIQPAEASDKVSGGVEILDDGRAYEDGMSFSAYQPDTAWRNLLPASGSVMGCAIGVNTADLVTLSCPRSAISPGMTVIAEGGKESVPSVLPANGVLVAGLRVEARGNLNLEGAALNIASVDWNFGALKVAASVLPTGGLVPQGNACLIGATLGSSGGLQTNVGNILNYGIFNIKAGDASNFNQSSASAPVNNAAAGGSIDILGKLQSNGQPFSLTTSSANANGPGTIFIAGKAAIP